MKSASAAKRGWQPTGPAAGPSRRRRRLVLLTSETFNLLRILVRPLLSLK